MTDITVTLTFENHDPIVADAKVGDRATLTAGRTVAMELYFSAAGSSTTTPAFDRYDALRQLVDGFSVADAVTTGVRDSAAPWFRERTPASFTESLVVGVESGADALPVSRDVWAVLTEFADVTGPTGAPYRVEVSLFILAMHDEYPDHAAVRDAFSPPFIG